MHRRLYGAAALFTAVPPLVGGSLMAVAGHYSWPAVYRAASSYAGPYILAWCLLAMFCAFRLGRHFTAIARMPPPEAALRLRRELPGVWLWLFAALALYSILGVLVVDASMAALGVRMPRAAPGWPVHLAGAVVPMLSAVMPLYFHFIATVDRYFAPRHIVAVTMSAHQKLFISCLVAPLLVDITLVTYYSNRDGEVDPKALWIWALLLACAVVAFLVARRALHDMISPLQAFLRGEPTLARARETLVPYSLDEVGVVTVQLLQHIEREEELRQDVEQLGERLLQASHATGMGIFDHDLRTGEVYWTRDVYRIFGVPEGLTVRLNSYLDTVHPEDLPRVGAAFERSRDPNLDGRYDIEHRIIRADGQTRWVVFHAQTFFDRSGATPEPVRVVGAVLDVDDRVQKERQRRTLETQLQEARRLETIGTFASGIAHDFNNILMIINSNLESALRELRDGHPALPHLDLVALAANRGSSLIGQISLFAQGQRQKTVPTNVASVLQETVRMIRATVPEGVSIMVGVGDSETTVMSGPGQLQQVLSNLIRNSIQALDKRPGLVRVSVRREPAGPAGAHVLITVTDSGVGMTAEVQQRIFEPFFTTRPAGSGSGLGLAVVYGIVRSLDGTISVHSAPGQGATFEIRLPAVDPMPGTG